jgi:GNAT superfamily N-acetyltransferase
MAPYGRYMTIGSLVIRPLEERPEAAQILAQWFHDEWPEYHKGRSLPDIASRFRLVPESQQTLIAEVDSQVVGTASLRGAWEAAPEIPPPWVGGLYVRTEFRGKGIGLALIDAIVDLAAADGEPVIHVSIYADPASYIRRGWRVIGTVFAGDENVTVLRIDTGA